MGPVPLPSEGRDDARGHGSAQPVAPAQTGGRVGPGAPVLPPTSPRVLPRTGEPPRPPPHLPAGLPCSAPHPSSLCIPKTAAVLGWGCPALLPPRLPVCGQATGGYLLSACQAGLGLSPSQRRFAGSPSTLASSRAGVTLGLPPLWGRVAVPGGQCWHWQPAPSLSRLPAAPEKGALFPGHSARPWPPRSVGTGASRAAAGGSWRGRAVRSGVGWWRKGRPFGTSLGRRAVQEPRLPVLPLCPWATHRQAVFNSSRAVVGNGRIPPGCRAAPMRLPLLAGLTRAGHHFQTPFPPSPERTWGCCISPPGLTASPCQLPTAAPAAMTMVHSRNPVLSSQKHGVQLLSRGSPAAGAGEDSIPPASEPRETSQWVCGAEGLCPQLCSWSCTAAPGCPSWSYAHRPAGGERCRVGWAPAWGPSSWHRCPRWRGDRSAADALGSAPGSPGRSGWEVTTSRQLPVAPVPLQPGQMPLSLPALAPVPASRRGQDGSEE